MHEDGTIGPSGSHAPSCIGCNLIVISGPSGAGKTTVSRALPGRLDLLVSTSATTRPPRKGEVEGVDYYFLSPEEFKARVAENRFVEWAEVFGHCYGTPIEGLELARKSGRMLLLEIDVQGGIQIKKKFPEALAILLLPPADQTLRQRLSHRGTESPQDVQRRFDMAQEEVRMARQSRCYDVEIVNDQLAATVNEVVSVIQTRRKQA
jgi:guanylate kinase